MILNGNSLPFSFSQNRTYEDCPRKYRFKYVDKIQEPSNEYLDLGNTIHKICELTPQIDLLEERQKEVDKLIGYTPTYKEQLLSELKIFFKTKEVLSCEEVWKTKEFTAKFDLVYKDKVFMNNYAPIEANKRIIIADYKVTRKPKTLNSVFTEGQLLIYKKIYCDFHPEIDPVDIFVQYVNISPYWTSKIINTTEPISPDINTCKNLYDSMMHNVSLIESGSFPKKTKWCNWCYYKPWCKKEE